jgi:hypothetical protein
MTTEARKRDDEGNWKSWNNDGKYARLMDKRSYGHARDLRRGKYGIKFNVESRRGLPSPRESS